MCPLLLGIPRLGLPKAAGEMEVCHHLSPEVLRILSGSLCEKLTWRLSQPASGEGLNC